MTLTNVRDRSIVSSRDGLKTRRKRRRLPYVAGGLGALVAAVWFGLRIEPAPLPPPAVQPGTVDTVPLPGGLPAPVERFYRTLYGDRVPVIDSAVISGRAHMRVAGITFPARFRFSHVTGQDYRHYIELTAFGRTVTTVDEWFLDGTARLDLPVGVSEGPNVDQGANLALWAEAVWMPAVWVTDPQVRWEPVDDTSAELVVPFGDGEEVLTVTFDPDSGLLDRMDSMRFKGEDDPTKTRWINEASEWTELGGWPTPLRTSVTWADEGGPWAILHTDEVLLNGDLATYVEASGP